MLFVTILFYLYMQIGIIVCFSSNKYDGSMIGYLVYVFTWPIMLWKGK